MERLLENSCCTHQKRAAQQTAIDKHGRKALNILAFYRKFRNDLTQKHSKTNCITFLVLQICVVVSSFKIKMS